MTTKSEIAESATRKGKHSPADWVRLLFALQAEGFSGELLLDSAKKTRRFMMVKGNLMDFRSDHEQESLAASLVKAKLLDEGNDLSQDDFQTEISVLESGLVSEEALETHHCSRLEQGLVAGLIQNTGNWEVLSNANLSQVEVARALYPKLDLWDTLWTGVKDHLDQGELLAWAGMSQRQFIRSAQVVLPYVEAANESFLQDRPAAAGLADFLKDAERPQDVPARLWILAATGILEVQDAEVVAAAKPSPEPEVEEQKPVAAQPRMSRTPLPTAPRPTGNQVEDLSAEYLLRMNKDYYAFLGLSSSATAEELREVARTLAQRMNALSRTTSLPDETRTQVRDMLAGVQRVYGTFTDRKRKEEYDRQLGLGEAPVIAARSNGGPPTSAPRASATQNRAFRLPGQESEEGNWGFFKKGKKQ